MARRLDLSGKKFEKLTVLSFLGKEDGKLYWVCVCDCGNFCKKVGNWISGGKSKSCGCVLRKHCKSGTRLHEIWMAMRARCRGTAGERSKYYYGKNITYDAKWDDFNFFLSDMEAGYSDDLELD